MDVPTYQKSDKYYNILSILTELTYT